MAFRRRGGFDDFVRGAERWMHSASMAALAVGTVSSAAWLLGSAAVLYLGARRTPNESYDLMKSGRQSDQGVAGYEVGRALVTERRELTVREFRSE